MESRGWTESCLVDASFFRVEARDKSRDAGQTRATFGRLRPEFGRVRSAEFAPNLARQVPPNLGPKPDLVRSCLLQNQSTWVQLSPTPRQNQSDFDTGVDPRFVSFGGFARIWRFGNNFSGTTIDQHSVGRLLRSPGYEPFADQAPKGPYILQRMSLAWRTLPHKKLVKAANAVAKLDLGGHLWAKPLKLALAKTLPQLSGKHFSNLKAITVMELLDEPDAMRSYLEHAEQWRSHVRRASEGPARGKSIEGWPHVLDKWGQNSEGVKSRYVDGLGPTVPGFARAAEIRGP